MSDKEDLKKRLKAISKESAARTDAHFEKEISTLKNAASSDIEALRSKITDTAAYDKLIAIVDVANRSNMDAAQLNKKITAAGADVVAVAKVVAKLLI